MRRLANRLLRGWGLRQLTRVTARGFGLPAPRLRVRRFDGRLAQYAAFSRQAALRSLERGEQVQGRLYDEALGLGRRLRRLLGIRSIRQALAACRWLYGQIAIDLQADEQGVAVVRRCYFSRHYEPAVCRVMSAVDRGLVAGLTGGGQLAFHRRITEGAACCCGRIEGLPRLAAQEVRA